MQAHSKKRRALALTSACLFLPGASEAFTININPQGPRTIYLQVGTGSFTGFYSTGGSPLDNPTINVVSVTVPAAQVGSGVPQTMSSNSAASNSFYNNRAFCTLPSQVYVGGYYRRPNVQPGPGATLTATAPANLVNATGDAIPFSQIQWTSSGIGDVGAQPFPAGTFTGGAQVIGTIARNQWAESCHTFSYLNTSVVPAGTYTGRVTYTLTAP